MAFDSADRYKPMQAALKKAGFKVDEVEKQDEKTVITISPIEEYIEKTREMNNK